MAAERENDLAIVGLVRKAQGIRGEILVEALTDTPDAVFASGRRLFAGNARGEAAPDRQELGVTDSRPFKGGWLLTVEGIADRNEAEKWRGRYLLAPFTELAPPGDDQVYLHDLIGMSVSSPARGKVGLVKAFYEMPQGIMLEVATESGDVLIPYRAEAITETNIESRGIVLNDDLNFLD